MTFIILTAINLSMFLLFMQHNKRKNRMKCLLPTSELFFGQTIINFHFVLDYTLNFSINMGIAVSIFIPLTCLERPMGIVSFIRIAQMLSMNDYCHSYRRIFFFCPAPPPLHHSSCILSVLLRLFRFQNSLLLIVDLVQNTPDYCDLLLRGHNLGCQFEAKVIFTSCMYHPHPLASSSLLFASHTPRSHRTRGNVF